MSEFENIMARFRTAIKAIEDRIAAAEARPSIEEVEKLKATRQADLAEFEKLKSEFNRLREGI